jgi:hypothetical protein
VLGVDERARREGGGKASGDAPPFLWLGGRAVMRTGKWGWRGAPHGGTGPAMPRGRAIGART